MSSKQPRHDPPFSRITVLDLSRLLPGGFCSLLLSDLGADVIKIEEPHVGDFYRKGTSRPILGSGAFEALNRGKQSLSLNLKTGEGRSIFLKLVKNADVVLESFRPGRLKKLGLHYARLSQVNPRIILCSISGYGQTGPDAQRAGHDLNYLSDAGVLGLSGKPGQDPPIPGFQMADLAGGGLYGALAIAVALYQRERIGKGAWVDLSMTEGAASLVGVPAVAAQLERKPYRKGSRLLDGGAASYNIYETKEGSHVALAALEPKFWQAFCHCVGLEGAGFAGFDEEVFSKRVKRRLKAIIQSRPLKYWKTLARKYDICLTPIRSLMELLRDPHFRSRRFFFKGQGPKDQPVHYMKTPFLFNGRRFYSRVRPPKYSGQTKKILHDLGYNDEEIQRLEEKGVI